MFQNKKLKSFFSTGTFLIFALTFVSGLTFNAISGRHVFVYSSTETFTEKEAAAKVNKRVRADFPSGRLIAGKVISYGVENGETFVTVEFDTPIVDTPATGKVFKLDFGKQNYRQLITEINPDE